MDTYLIAGLGNPGKKYENTRHNTGFEVVDILAGLLGVSINESKFRALCGDTKRNGSRLLLIKPLTFMNLSGEAVLEISSYFDIPKEHIIIISDDVYLDLGRIRVRARGSSGGHNGLKNIIDCLKTEDFPRVRVGVGPIPERGETFADFVLSHFNRDSYELRQKAFRLAADATISVIDEGIPRTMDRYNGLNLAKQLN